MEFLFYLIIIMCFIGIYNNVVIPVYYLHIKRKLIKYVNELDEILRKLYRSDKRALIKTDNKSYSIPNCFIYIVTNKKRQWIMNDIYNLRNEEILKDWTLEYTDSNTLTFKRKFYSVILKFY